MWRTPEPKLRLGFSIAIIAVAAGGAVALWTSGRTTQSTQWVTHSLDVEARLREVTGHLRYVESVAQDPRSLRSVGSARDALAAAVRQLRSLTLDNPDQWPRADSLAALIPPHLAALQRSMDRHQPSGAGHNFLPAEDRAGAGQIDTLIARMDAAEQRLLHTRSAAMQRRADRVRIAVWTSTLLALMAVLAAARLVRRQLAGRRDAEGQLRAVIESAPSGMVMVDASGRIALVNRQVERVFGYSRAELLGQPVDVLIPERFRAYHVELRAQFSAHPGRRPSGAMPDLFGRNKAGVEIPVEIELSPIETGGASFVLASIVDTRARKRADARFRAAVESSPSGMMMIDRAGKVVLTNRESERLFGYASDGLLGRRFESLFPLRVRERCPQLRDVSFAEPAAWPIGAGRDLFGVRQDGTEVPVEIGLNPIETEEGPFVLASVVDRGQSEQELRRSNDELARFAYVASHDLQEPLRMVASYVQLLAKRYKGKLDSDADDFIGFALDGALRMQQLIADLLAFSRVGAGAAPASPTDANRVLDRVRANLQLAIDESGATLTAGPLPTLPVDAGQLEHLLQNLVANALKFRGAAAPTVDVSAARVGSDWHFQVRDNGIGIEPQYLERIFVIFQRLHGREQYEGTGMGLAITKKIVELRGGRIWATSTPGQGSTFHFTLPAGREDT